MNKSDKSKSSLLIIFIAVFAVILTFILGKNILNIKYIVREEGYYKYLVLTSHNEIFEKKDDPVAIVGFTKEGYKQDYLHIPKEINGHPVKYIGFDETVGGKRINHPFIGSGIKKLYVYDNIEYIEDVLNCEDVDLMLCRDNINFKSFVHYFFNDVYVDQTVYNSLQNNVSWLKTANVSFMNNLPSEGNDTNYSIENIAEGEKINMPPEPICEGYNFTGWYTEPECIKKFDFSISPTIEDNKIFRLYAGWTIR